MKKNRIGIYLILLIIAVISLTTYIYNQVYEKNSSGIFPEKLGDMSITSFREGPSAVIEVKNLHRGTVQIENAYIADYGGPAGTRLNYGYQNPKTAGQLSCC